jgi:hypothetical protein
MTMSKKSIVISSLLALFIIIGGIAYLKNTLPWFRGDLPNCIVLRSRNIRAEVHYPDAFKDVSYPTAPRVKRKGSSGLAEGAYILAIDAEGFSESLRDIIGVSPGPLYATSTFNGYPAGFATQFDAGIGTDKIYKFPVGNDTLMISYSSDQLSPDLKVVADKMLRSVTITQTSENIKQTAVEACR